MTFTSFIATRYMLNNRENRFISWVTNLSVIGIAIGVAAMIVVLSVINGFETELRNRFLAANAHILGYRFPEGLKDYPRWEQSVGTHFGKDISGVAPFVYSETMGRKSHLVHSMVIRGISPTKRELVQSLKDIVRPASALDDIQAEIDRYASGEGIADLPGIILGSRLSSIMDAQVGDTIQLVSPKMDSADPFGAMKPFKVLGIYDSGLLHYDNRIGIMSIPAAQDLFSMDHGIVTGIEIGLKNPDNSPAIASRMQELYNISIKEWQSYNRPIFDAMSTERTVIAFIVALVAFVASFNILTTLFVSVTQKRNAIALLKSLGANNRQILMIFIKQSFLVGTVGGLMGMVFAFFLGLIIRNYKIIDLPEIYLLAKLPVAFDWRVYAGVALSSMLIAIVAGVYPAIIAARVSPIQGLTIRPGD